MPGSPSASPPSGRHGDPTAAPTLRGRSLDWGRSLDGDPEEPEGYAPTPPPPEATGVGVGVACLDRKWLLWQDAMADHAHLEAWLRLADQACGGPAHISYLAATEALRRLERLRREAGPWLAHADALARRDRTLARLFDGALRSRLLALARSCGRRCEDAVAAMETAAARLKRFVAEWEEFEEEGAELALRLADLEADLSEVDHVTGSGCEKLKQLQGCVCVNAARLDNFLRRGEALMRRCGDADARRVERELLALLRRHSGVFEDIARTHTRLLSLRLVFEDDHFLSPGPDSGCPSESLLDEEAWLDRPPPDPPAWPRPPAAPPLAEAPPPDDPVLEWDPSVDVGHSVRHEDADSSYSSAGVKRRSYLSSLSDISSQDQEVEWRLKGWLDHAHSAAAAPAEAPWATSTPGRRAAEPASFDRGRVRAWLGVQSPAPTAEVTSCSRAVQTEASGESTEEGGEEGTSSGDAALSLAPPPVSTPLPLPLLILLFLAVLLLAALCWRLAPGALMPFRLHLMLTYVNGPPPT